MIWNLATSSTTTTVKPSTTTTTSSTTTTLIQTPTTVQNTTTTTTSADEIKNSNEMDAMTTRAVVILAVGGTLVGVGSLTLAGVLMYLRIKR